MDTARIFTNGRSQAVRLPREYRFEGSEVCIRRIGRMVVMFDPRERNEMMMGALGKVTDDFMSDRNQPKLPDRRKRL